MSSSDGEVSVYRSYVITARRGNASIVISNGDSEIAHDKKNIPDEIWNRLIASVPNLKDGRSDGCIDAGITSVVVADGDTTVKNAVEWCPGPRWDQMRRVYLEPVEALFDMPRLLNRPGR
ncbi:hypothetical protein [Mycobacterium sp. NPDC050853]|uniref:hypothetical protein n=1 Tax=Mycobacterium sp. NPDC050853 TaxID=3155160 RepID=UPI0033D7A9A3